MRVGVGSVVHYRERDAVRAALVTEVHADADDGAQVVSLVVFHQGTSFVDGVRYDASAAPGTFREPSQRSVVFG